jgi:large subunit ribosomal protein L7/L12
MFENIINQLEAFTIIQMNDLVKTLEAKWGVSAAAPVSAAISGTAAIVEEQKFMVKLIGFHNKVTAVKYFRGLNSALGLKEAVDIVDQSSSKPYILKKELKKEEAEKIKEEASAAGCSVEVGLDE